MHNAQCSILDSIQWSLEDNICSGDCYLFYFISVVEREEDYLLYIKQYATYRCSDPLKVELSIFRRKNYSKHLQKPERTVKCIEIRILSIKLY